MYQAAKKRSKKRRRTGTAKAKMKIKAFPSRVQEVEHAGGSFQRQSLGKAQEKDDIDKLEGQEERQLSSRAKHLRAARSWVSNKFKFAIGEVCSSWKRRKNLFYASELPECATKSQKRIFNTGTSTLRAKKHEQSTSKRGSSKLRAEAIKQDSVGDMTETAGRLGGSKRKVNAQSKKNAWFTNAIKQRVNLGLRTTTDIQVLREELESVVSSFDIVKWGKILAYAAELLKRSSEYEELSDGQERAILQYFGSKLTDMPLFISREKVLAILNEHKGMFPRVQYSIALQISIERYIIRRDCSAASNKRWSSLTLPSRRSQYAVAKATKRNSLTTASVRQKPRGNKSELREKSKGVKRTQYPTKLKRVNAKRITQQGRAVSAPNTGDQVKHNASPQKESKKRAQPARVRKRKLPVSKKANQSRKSYKSLEQGNHEEYLRKLLYTEDNEPKWEVSI